MILVINARTAFIIFVKKLDFILILVTEMFRIR